MILASQISKNLGSKRGTLSRPRALDLFTCDGPLYKGKMVAVVGGGNSALQTALEMSEIAKSVSLIVRSHTGRPVYVEKLNTKKNITVHKNTLDHRPSRREVPRRRYHQG